MNIHVPEFFRGRLAMISLRVAQIVFAIGCILAPIVALVQMVVVATATGSFWLTILCIPGAVVAFFCEFAFLVIITLAIGALTEMSLRDAMGETEPPVRGRDAHTDFVVRCANDHAVPVSSASAGCTISCPVCRVNVTIPPLSQLRGSP